MATVTLKRGEDTREYSQEHAQNILNHPIQATIDKDMKYVLPSDSKWVFKGGELKRKTEKEKK